MKESIIVEHISKAYHLGTPKSLNFRESFKLKKIKREQFWALEDINFKCYPGETIGIIGRNGAGKSTLLKILSRITEPTKGKFILNGRVSSLLEVGTGFHSELTGRENIFLNGTILGMRKSEINKKFDEIVSFSGVEKFIDTPVKHYSSGMKVRLAFSVAAHLEPEILIVDEVLAVGDAEFQKKCLGKMGEVSRNEGRTVLFVSHNIGAVRQLCQKGILLNKGKIDFLGTSTQALIKYSEKAKEQSIYIPEHVKDTTVAFKKIYVSDVSSRTCTSFTVEEEIILNFSFLIKESNHPYSLFVIIKDKFGTPVFSAETKIDQQDIILKLEKRFLTRGSFSIHTFIHIPKIKQIDIAEDICQFSISDSSSPLAIHGEYEYGNVFGNYNWIRP